MAQSEQTAADPASAILNIVTDLGRQLAQSAKTLTETRDDEVEIGTAEGRGVAVRQGHKEAGRLDVCPTASKGSIREARFAGE
jgi:hypothetical protein